tara:strand:+ start:239 stop:958 length:720 start_codon:yes stop_codon:yes gene_type:complete
MENVARSLTAIAQPTVFNLTESVAVAVFHSWCTEAETAFSQMLPVYQSSIPQDEQQTPEELRRQLEDGVASLYVWYDNHAPYQAAGGAIVVRLNSGIKALTHFFNAATVRGQGVGKAFLSWLAADMANSNCWLVLEIDAAGEAGIAEDERLTREHRQALYREAGAREITGVPCHLPLDNAKGTAEKVLMLFAPDTVQYLPEGKVTAMVSQLFHVAYGKEPSHPDFPAVLRIPVGHHMLV